MANSAPDAPALLIVDDDHRNLFAAKAVLDSLGFLIVTAVTGREALQYAASRDFVTMLVDVHMPGMDGYETVAALRGIERARDVPIIFLTAVYDQQEHTRRGYALGAIDYITKPFDPIVLQTKVRGLVALYLRGQREERVRSHEVERMKDLFLGAVGHDLRNPLSAIALAAKLMKKDACAEPSHIAHAERIDRAATRMERIIEDILDFTRGEFTGAIPLAIGQTDLVEICRGTIGELQAAHAPRSIELDAPPVVTGAWDSGRVERMVSNLLGNALQHSSGGRVRVIVRQTAVSASVEVHNEGKPIPEEVQARLFEPFRRGETVSEGLGLGLYIVREIARAHGGSVEVHSSERAGTVFRVTLPRGLECG